VRAHHHPTAVHHRHAAPAPRVEDIIVVNSDDAPGAGGGTCGDDVLPLSEVVYLQRS
jgi:hypothetical protein